MIILEKQESDKPKDFHMSQKPWLFVAIILTAGLILSACSGPAETGDQLKLTTPTESESKTTEQKSNQLTQTELSSVQTTELSSGKDLMIDNSTTTTQITATQATIKTSKGDITIKLYTEDAPKTVENFLQKAQTNYYTNLIFHRVEDWVIQGGDPKGNGTGGGSMATELNQQPFKAGSVGVARGGNIQISNDSQFFICTTDCAWLTGQYTNFGEVTVGMDVVKAIAIGDKILGISYK